MILTADIIGQFVTLEDDIKSEYRFTLTQEESVKLTETAINHDIIDYFD